MTHTNTDCSWSSVARVTGAPEGALCVDTLCVDVTIVCICCTLINIYTLKIVH